MQYNTNGNFLYLKIHTEIDAHLHFEFETLYSRRPISCVRLFIRAKIIKYLFTLQNKKAARCSRRNIGKNKTWKEGQDFLFYIYYIKEFSSIGQTLFKRLKWNMFMGNSTQIHDKKCSSGWEIYDHSYKTRRQK